MALYGEMLLEFAQGVDSMSEAALLERPSGLNGPIMLRLELKYFNAVVKAVRQGVLSEVAHILESGIGLGMGRVAVRKLDSYFHFDVLELAESSGQWLHECSCTKVENLNKFVIDFRYHLTS